ncbi:hypothetical protein DNTS_021070 [Danionella cerebrum]|uniref:B30.2/SPRY domain-containing protein n=1 Tax=Danionella cerebrum TaxID=2873325 RepID=A0A553Q286_9TELE|nr:hypothetical protein DNTS_021070 [Danionella translucida]
MAFIKEMLLSTLEELLEAELKTFQWNLRNNYEDITKSEMENADRLRTVDKLVECFGTEEAVRIMIETLKRMNKNFLSEQLELKYNQGSTKDDYKTTTVDYLEISNRLKNQLMKAYRTILTGNSDRGCRECLDEIFTDIYMVKNEIGDAFSFTLDPDTAHSNLILSEENKTVTRWPIPTFKKKDIISDEYQVLCRENVHERCYWEAYWKGRKGVCLSVSYKSSRVQQEFGSDDESWGLICTPDGFRFRHKNIQTPLHVESISNRVGVYVDHSAGLLSFYSISDKLRLIYSIQTTFTQTLYPGFGLYDGSFVELCMYTSPHVIYMGVHTTGVSFGSEAGCSKQVATNGQVAGTE